MINSPFSLRPGSAVTGGAASRLRGACAAGATGEGAAFAVSTGARPVPEISKAGTSRTTGLLTACSTRRPLAKPGLVNACGTDDLNVMDGGCMTAKLATGYAGFT